MSHRSSLSYFALCAVALLTILSGSMVNPLLSIFAKNIGATGVIIGLVVASYWTSRVFLEIPSGLLSSKLGYFTPMALGLSLTSLGNFLCRFVNNPYQLMIARMMIGLGAPLFYAVAMTFVVDTFTTERRGSAMGFFQGVEFIGTVVGASLSGYVVSLFSFRGAFLLSAALGAAALALLTVSGIRGKRREEADASVISPSSILEALRSKNLLIVGGSIFAEFVLSTGVLYTILPIYLKEEVGLSLTTVGLTLAARSFGFVTSMFIMGTISDRFGRRPVLIFGLTATGLLSIALSHASSVPFIAATIFGIGLSTGAIWIVSPVIAAESVRPALRGAAIGTYRTFFDLGSILGPIIMTIINEGLGRRMCFYVAAMILLANVLPALWMRETR
ncbi:MFS transporter [Candidatus Bathyarchaeota archaeon]|nr:MAG: MFS transporter [Candidatus Bathyarchaeota archaeon]